MADMIEETRREPEAHHVDASTTTTTAIIDPTGDVTLQVGKTDVTTNLLVSSKVLCLASPVFATMMSPRFLEGVELANGSLRPLPLPDDVPEAVALLCNIIHLRSQLVSTQIRFPLFEELALLCDKYDTSSAVTPWSTLWFQQWRGSSLGEDRHQKLLYISYSYNNGAVFNMASWNMLRTAEPATFSSSVGDGVAVLPEELISELQLRRDEISSSLYKAIEVVLLPLLTTPRAVTCNKPRAFFSPFASGNNTSRPFSPFGSGNTSRAFSPATPTQCECTSCTINRRMKNQFQNGSTLFAEPKPCFSAVRIGAYILELARLGLWPLSEQIPNQDLQTVLDRLLSFQEFTPDNTGCGCRTCSVSLKDELAEVSRQHSAMIRGLCLVCVKSGRLSPAKGNCQGS